VAPAHPRHHLINLQRLLYEKAFADAYSLESQNHELVSYSKNFENNLPLTFKTTDIREVVLSLIKSKLGFYGDFHTLRQAQRGLVRLLKEALLISNNAATITIAMEAFKASQQSILDQYMAHEIDDDTFLNLVEYEKNWGFPWNNYKMILDFARDFNIKVIGINGGIHGKKSLSGRDRFAAKTLADYRTEHPDDLVICMIGQYHLADEHLPAALRAEFLGRGLKPEYVNILTNVDKYFFELTGDLQKTTEYLRLKKNLYCIMNSPPWIKWHSYTMWEEVRDPNRDLVLEMDDAGAEESDIHTEITYDIDHHFLAMTENLAKFLNAPLKRQRIETFNIYSAFEFDLINLDAFGEDIAEGDMFRYIERSNLDGAYYLPQDHTILISRLSVNGLAEVAGQFFFQLQTNFDENHGTDREQFYRRIIKFTIGMVASKIFNPRRKCMTIFDYQRFLKFNRGKRLQGTMRSKRETAQAVIHHHQWLQSQSGDLPPRNMQANFIISRQDLALDFEISRAFGLMMGFYLYSKVISNQYPSDRLKDLFSTSFHSFSEVWALITELTQLIETEKHS
jgi:uncharacterized iron-regulated protein